MKKNSLDFFSGVFSVLLNFGLNIILLPTALFFLTSFELRLWYLFSGLTAFAIVISSALNQSFIRYLVYSKGNENLHENKSSDIKKLNYSSIIFTGKVFFYGFSLIFSFSLFFIGPIYLNQFINSPVQTTYWQIYLFSTTLNLISPFYSSIMRSNFRIFLENSIVILTRIINIILTLIFSFLGFGLFGFTLAFFIKSLLTFLLFFLYSQGNLVTSVSKEINSISQSNQLNNLKILFVPSLKQVINNLSGWLINKGTTLILAIYLTDKIFNSYSVTLQIFGILISLSSVFFNNISPQIAESIKLNDTKKILKSFSISLFIAYIIQFFGSLFILVLGNYIIGLISENISLNFIITLVYSIFVFFELNQAIFSGFISLHNEFPFVKSSIISGILIILLSYIGITLFNFGLFEAIFVMFLVQSFYNFWKWPLYVCKKYKTSLIGILKSAISNFTFQ